MSHYSKTTVMQKLVSEESFIKKFQYLIVLEIKTKTQTRHRCLSRKEKFSFINRAG